MKIVVRMVETAPCRNENTSSIAALGSEAQPAAVARDAAAGQHRRRARPAIFGIRYMVKNAT